MSSIVDVRKYFRLTLFRMLYNLKSTIAYYERMGKIELLCSDSLTLIVEYYEEEFRVTMLTIVRRGEIDFYHEYEQRCN